VDTAELTSTFLDLARIDSPSRHEGKVAQYVTARLQAAGWTVLDDGTGPEVGNLIARVGGSGEPLALTAHLDVVPPCSSVRPQLTDGWIASDGTTVLGADAKAGIAVMLELAPAIGAAGRPVELLFTWGEELGHVGAKALSPDALRSRRALVLDALMPVGTIVHRAPTYVALTIDLRGPGGHAGVDAGRVRSTNVIAAAAIARCAWGRLDQSTTANLGIVRGGTALNAIAPTTHVEVEVRGLEERSLDDRIDGIRRAFEGAAGSDATLEMDIDRRYRGYSLASDAPIVDLARRAFTAIGGTPRLESTFGGSDANELNPRGIAACVLGIGAERCHSTSERIAVNELGRLAQWVRAIVAAL
jgi:tripeptide aminopeptidase